MDGVLDPFVLSCGLDWDRLSSDFGQCGSGVKKRSRFGFGTDQEAFGLENQMRIH